MGGQAVKELLCLLRSVLGMCCRLRCDGAYWALDCAVYCSSEEQEQEFATHLLDVPFAFFIQQWCWWLRSALFLGAIDDRGAGKGKVMFFFGNVCWNFLSARAT